MRAAVLTTSPVTLSPIWGPAPNATTASPVAIPTRAAIAGPGAWSPRIPSWMASPARTARSGSSSCATGAPNTPSAASPTNLSSVPPNRSISSRSRAWYGRRVAFTSSGSARSARSVNPTRSQNRTLTIRRSSAGAGPAPDRRMPQAEQKRAAVGFSSPQEGQRTMEPSSLWGRVHRPVGTVRPVLAQVRGEAVPERGERDVERPPECAEVGDCVGRGEVDGPGRDRRPRQDLDDEAGQLREERREVNEWLGPAPDIHHGDQHVVHGHHVGPAD